MRIITKFVRIFLISVTVVGVQKIELGLEVILVNLWLLKLLFRSTPIVVKYLLQLFKFSDSDF